MIAKLWEPGYKRDLEKETQKCDNECQRKEIWDRAVCWLSLNMRKSCLEWGHTNDTITGVDEAENDREQKIGTVKLVFEARKQGREIPNSDGSPAQFRDVLWDPDKEWERFALADSSHSNTGASCENRQSRLQLRRHG